MIFVSNPKFSLMPFEEALRKVEKKFDGWEILAEKYHSWKYREEIKDALSTTDLEVQIHAPLNDINIASINPNIRKTSVKEVKKSIEMASMIGAEMVTVHPGLYSPLSIYWDRATDSSKESLRDLKEYAGEYEILLTLENLPDMWLSMCSTAKETRNFLDELDIEFCLDVGHAYTAGELEKFLEFSPVNVHLHDNLGEDDIHLRLGEGKIDFRRILEALRDYEGNFVIEGRDIKELIESNKYLTDMLNELKIG
ncbi:MAG: sugar phosphate isomerase/epimerase [Candidatus Thermoplasmatota archaeon]|nr:sugar phosphate isomerase/epimerase [Candidatus Thermoplasmatota archaeon]MBS3790689.1 sugar phosphate isomerase/epimerase [Candidatus Thermoplasmatota archaeon]